MPEHEKDQLEPKQHQKQVNTTSRSLLHALFFFGTANDADRKNQMHFAAWMLFSGTTFVAVSWIVKKTPIENPLLLAVAFVPVVVGLFTMRSAIHMLRGMDEMMRIIQLEALALACGSGIIFVPAYPLLLDAGAPAFLNEPFMLMVAVWTAGQLNGLRRLV